MIKPILPRFFQVFIRKQFCLIKRFLYAKKWPIDYSANKKPENWKGWLNNKKFALIISHDVESEYGYKKVKQLAEIDESYKFKSSFNFVPLKYNVEKDLRIYLKKKGFEINIHGLYHDGKLFLFKKIFDERAKIINKYLKDWGCKGFYAPSTIKKYNWLHCLDILFDASSFDTDPFEPQPKGVKTIFPFKIYNKDKTKFYIEIPYTLPQDSTLYLIMKEKDIDIWKRKLDWIVENNGLVHIRTHPDYINFNNEYNNYEYPIKFYCDLLEYITTKYKNQYWHILPTELAEFWKNNSFINENNLWK